MNLYDPENTKGRIDYACRYISEGRNNGDTTRKFCGCMECDDHEEVFLAVWKRAETNQRLMDNIERYLVRP